MKARNIKKSEAMRFELANSLGWWAGADSGFSFGRGGQGL